ncbi:MAG: hypothetical protein JNK56_22980, partial [Myxococcales bacterium]|nr:hypothetical protein [Myxococcales bacterium]
MPSRPLLLALLLLGCHPGPQAQPQPTSAAPDARAREPATPGPASAEPTAEPATAEPATVTPAERPAFSDPHADRALADTLPSPAPASRLPASCEGGTRRPGETWKVECN